MTAQRKFGKEKDRKIRHAEFISTSQFKEIPKQVRDDG